MRAVDPDTLLPCELAEFRRCDFYCCYSKYRLLRCAAAATAVCWDPPTLLLMSMVLPMPLVDPRLRPTAAAVVLNGTPLPDTVGPVFLLFAFPPP